MLCRENRKASTVDSLCSFSVGSPKSVSGTLRARAEHADPGRTLLYARSTAQGTEGAHTSPNILTCCSANCCSFHFFFKLWKFTWQWTCTHYCTGIFCLHFIEFSKSYRLVKQLSGGTIGVVCFRDRLCWVLLVMTGTMPRFCLQWHTCKHCSRLQSSAPWKHGYTTTVARVERGCLFWSSLFGVNKDDPGGRCGWVHLCFDSKSGHFNCLWHRQTHHIIFEFFLTWLPSPPIFFHSSSTVLTLLSSLWVLALGHGNIFHLLFSLRGKTHCFLLKLLTDLSHYLLISGHSLHGRSLPDLFKH